MRFAPSRGFANDGGNILLAVTRGGPRKLWLRSCAPTGHSVSGCADSHVNFLIRNFLDKTVWAAKLLANHENWLDNSPRAFAHAFWPVRNTNLAVAESAKLSRRKTQSGKRIARGRDKHFGRIRAKKTRGRQKT